MATAQFKLDMFEGPLDLLLHLITKHKLNIYDIEIAVLLEQYLAYMDGLEEEDYEDAADFLEMAARLIYIKTVSLLPRDNEGEELKKELQGSLIEYSLCKMAAANLKEQYAGGDIFVRAPVKLPVNKTFTGVLDKQKLFDAYMGMSEKAQHAKPLKADMFKPILSRRIVSVTSKIIHVLKMLITKGECFLDSMYDGCTDKSERVAVFLAVLELTKSGRIFLNDDNTRVYMNSASKKRRIDSHFDRAEMEAEQPDRAADVSENGDLLSDERRGVSEGLSENVVSYPAEVDDAARRGSLPPQRTVYKSESRQRSTLPVLKIELAPSLQKLVDEGRKDIPEGESPETADIPQAVSLEKHEGGSPSELQAVSAESPETADIPQAVSLAKHEGGSPSELQAVSADAPETAGVPQAVSLAEHEGGSQSGLQALSAESPDNADIPQTVSLAKHEGGSPSESQAVSAESPDNAGIADDVSPCPVRRSLFAARFYWGAQGWSAWRLRIR